MLLKLAGAPGYLDTLVYADSGSVGLRGARFILSTKLPALARLLVQRPHFDKQDAGEAKVAQTMPPPLCVVGSEAAGQGCPLSLSLEVGAFEMSSCLLSSHWILNETHRWIWRCCRETRLGGRQVQRQRRCLQPRMG